MNFKFYFVSFLLIFLSLVSELIVAQTVITIAGTGVAGALDGQGTSAQLNGPSDLIADNQGNYYIIDQYGCRIRKMNASFYITTVAGGSTCSFADGQGTQASFNNPIRGILDPHGILIFTDHTNHRIRKLNSSGYVSTYVGSTAGFQDGPISSAMLQNPTGIIMDQQGNIFFAELNRIRKITMDGTVSTFAGSGSVGAQDGWGTAATFSTPYGIILADSGDFYVADWLNHRIRKISPLGEVTTFAGNGTAGSASGQGIAATFNRPVDIIQVKNGDFIVLDRTSRIIRKITPSGHVSRFAGSGSSGSADGVGVNASFVGLMGTELDAKGNVLIADREGHRIRLLCNDTCPPGDYFSSTACCQPCDVGFYQPRSGQTSCLSCPVNAVCNAGSTMFSCNPGFTLDSETNSCTDCPDNYFKLTSGNDPCVACPVDSTCTSTGYTCNTGLSYDANQNKCVFKPTSTARMASVSSIPSTPTPPVTTTNGIPKPADSQLTFFQILFSNTIYLSLFIVACVIVLLLILLLVVFTVRHHYGKRPLATVLSDGSRATASNMTTSMSQTTNTTSSSSSSTHHSSTSMPRTPSSQSSRPQSRRSSTKGSRPHHRQHSTNKSGQETPHPHHPRRVMHPSM